MSQRLRIIALMNNNFLVYIDEQTSRTEIGNNIGQTNSVSIHFKNFVADTLFKWKTHV